MPEDEQQQESPPPPARRRDPSCSRGRSGRTPSRRTAGEAVEQAVHGQRERQGRKPQHQDVGDAEVAGEIGEVRCTISPPVDIIVIMDEHQPEDRGLQHVGRRDVFAAPAPLSWGGASPGLGSRRPSAARTPTPPRRTPNTISVIGAPRSQHRGYGECSQHRAHSVARRDNPDRKPRRSGNHLAIRPTMPT